MAKRIQMLYLGSDVQWKTAKTRQILIKTAL
jgi:hypothetical protein